MNQLQIPKHIIDKIIAQAIKEAPIEACGILAGKNNIVENIYEMENADQSNDHFMMKPQEQFSVAKNIREAGLDMLAVYHSHPETPARPSDEDIRLALTPGVIYVIASLANSDNPVVKGFLIEDGNVNEVPLKITEPINE